MSGRLGSTANPVRSVRRSAATAVRIATPSEVSGPSAVMRPVGIAMPITAAGPSAHVKAAVRPAPPVATSAAHTGT